MKVKLIAAAIAVVSLSGCAQRDVSPEEQAMTNAAYKGAAMQAALANAHSVAIDSKEIGSDDGESKHHHRHKRQDSYSSNAEEDEKDNGVIYRQGKKGYLNSDGDFIQYGQSAHRKQNKTSCQDLDLFVESGTELTPAQEKALAGCRIHGQVKHGQTTYDKTWKGYGVTVEQHADGQVFVDGKPAVLDEKAEGSTAYSQGLNSIIIYDNGKVALVVGGTAKGYLK